MENKEFSFSSRYYDIMERSTMISEMSDTELLNFKKEAEEVRHEYENFQLVVKCDCNSLYGVSANKFFSLHDTDVAEDITVTGKHFAVLVDYAINNFFVSWGDEELKIVQQFYPQVVTLRKFTEYKPYTKDDLCCYGDTDSRYLRIDKIYELLLTDNGKMQLPESDIELADFVVFIEKHFISKLIKKEIDEDCEKRNARKGFLKMAHEVTTRKAIFLKKKKYIMTPFWKDGRMLAKTKLKFTGVELKKGSMSEKAKKILNKLVDKYLLDGFTNEQLRVECIKIIQYIKLKKDKELIYQLSSVSGLDDIKMNDSGVWISGSGKNHIQMQIALSWYNFIEENNIKEQYRPPFEGQKMQYYYCSPESGYKVIGIPDDFNINDIKLLPEPDWNKMIITSLMKPMCRYLLDKVDVEDSDVEAFLLGAKIWNFTKK